MKALEILQVAIEEGVFVVPFNLQRDSKSFSVWAIDNANVVYFVRNRLARLCVQ